MSLLFGLWAGFWKFGGKTGFDSCSFVLQGVFSSFTIFSILFWLKSCTSSYQPNCLPSCKLFWSFMQVCGAPEGHLSSYAFALMVIYFLLLGSKEKLLASVQSGFRWKISDRWWHSFLAIARQTDPLFAMPCLPVDSFTSQGSGLKAGSYSWNLGEKSQRRCHNRSRGVNEHSFWRFNLLVANLPSCFVSLLLWKRTWSHHSCLTMCALPEYLSKVA